MRLTFRTCAVLSALCVLVAEVGAAGPPWPATPEQGRKAIERGLEFVQKDAVKWRKDHKCSTCHHGTMTVWVQSEAKSRGYDVPDDSSEPSVFGRFARSNARRTLSKTVYCFCMS